VHKRILNKSIKHRIAIGSSIQRPIVLTVLAMCGQDLDGCKPRVGYAPQRAGARRAEEAEEAAVGEEAVVGGGEVGGREPWGGVAGVA
jgi:hypothetical protein